MVLTIIITTVFLVFIMLMALGPRGEEAKQKEWQTLFIAYAWISTLVGFFYGISLTTSSVIGEKDKKTYDFMFMTPLTDRTIAIGKLLGSSLHLWLILAIILPFLVISGISGNITPVKVIVFCLVLMLGSLLCAACGMFISVSITKMTSSLIGVIIVLGGYVFSGMLGIAFQQSEPHLEFFGLLSPVLIIFDISNEFTRWPKDFGIISFFNNDIYNGWFTIFIYIWLTFWIMRAVIRKIRNLQGRYFTQSEALIIFVVFEILLVGFQWEPISNYECFWYSLATYLLTNGILLVALSCGLTLSRDDYFSYVRQRILKTPPGLLRKQSPPHVLHIILYLIMIGGLLVMPFHTDNILLVWLEIWVLIATVSIFYLLAQFLKTILVYAGTVVAFVISGAALGIPPIFLAAFGISDTYFIWFNPIAYIAETHWFSSRHLMEYYSGKPFSDTDLWFHPILLAVILIIMLVLFIFRHIKIKHIIRRRMEL